MGLSHDERSLAERHAALFAKGEAGEVIEEVCAIFGVAKSAVLSAARGKSAISEARQVIYFILYERGWTLEAIAEAMGRTHATVTHGIKRVRTTPELRALAK